MWPGEFGGGNSGVPVIEGGVSWVPESKIGVEWLLVVRNRTVMNSGVVGFSDTPSFLKDKQ